MSLLGWTLLLLANHGNAFANPGSTAGVSQWEVNSVSDFTESRCPDEWAGLAGIEPDVFGARIVERSKKDDHLLRVVRRDWQRLFGHQHEHFTAFVVIATSQVGTNVTYQDYLRTGSISHFDGDATRLRQVLAAKTALLGCMLPQENEIGWLLYDRLWSTVLDPLECNAWLKLSEDVLALDVAAAGTTASKDQLTAVLEQTIGQCEKEKTL